jgi:hypothetical protein
MSYIGIYFNHALAVQKAARPLGVDACVQLADTSLHLQAGRRSEVWRPKFLALINGRLVYTDKMVKGTMGFAGWLPYQRRQWPIARDKSAFKHHAIAQGIATPAACFDPDLIGGPFIIKQPGSSFGEGIRGPFVSYEPGDPAHQLAHGEYYENFIVGHIAKAWCWASKCIAIHLHKPSIVTGDGETTLRGLVLALPNIHGDENDWRLIDRLAAYSGVKSTDDVLPSGKEVLVEFRYGSRYELASSENRNVLGNLAGTPLAQQFEDAAFKLAPAISEDPQARNCLYTLDAMVDGQGQVWFLEMNCNPLVHPDAYASMLQSQFS